MYLFNCRICGSPMKLKDYMHSDRCFNCCKKELEIRNHRINKRNYDKCMEEIKNQKREKNDK